MAKHYVICENDCLVEAYTAEEVTALIQSATGYTPTGNEKAVISQIINQNSGGESVKIWLGTRAEYNALPQTDANTIYHIVDDMTPNAVYDYMVDLENKFRTYDGDFDGVIDNARQLDGRPASYYAKKTDLDNVKGSIGDKAPTSHADTSTKHGLGNNDKYGHLKLSDSLYSNSDVFSGVAATPRAVRDVNEKAEEISQKVDTLITDITQIKFVTSLPADAKNNTKTLYLIAK